MKRLSFILLTMCLTIGCWAQQHETDVFTTTSGKTVKFTCIKHASIMVEYYGKVIYFDPVA